jgi:hypothetical protein
MESSDDKRVWRFLSSRRRPRPLISEPWSLNNNRFDPRTSPRVIITFCTAINAGFSYK